LIDVQRIRDVPPLPPAWVLGPSRHPPLGDLPLPARPPLNRPGSSVRSDRSRTDAATRGKTPRHARSQPAMPRQSGEARRPDLEHVLI
jgi:hypothetical protein